MSDRASFAGVASLTTVVALLMTVLRGGSADHQIVVAPPDRVAGAEGSAGTRSTGAARTAGAAGERHVVLAGRTGPEMLTAFLGRSYTSPPGDGSRFPLRVLVVSVPDPVDSHLDWAYDAGLEAVRRAVERAGYTLDRFWIPSPGELDTVSAAPGLVVRPLRTTRPGVLLFRASADTGRREGPRTLGDPQGLLLAYLVPEVPTAGVAKEALLAALRERASLLSTIARPSEAGEPATTVYADSAEQDTVRVVGPFWSGSAESLRLALETWHAEQARSAPAAARHGGPGGRPKLACARRAGSVIDVVSGTATAPTVESFVLGSRLAPPPAAPRARGDRPPEIATPTYDSASGRLYSSSCEVARSSAASRSGAAPLCVAFRRTTNTTLAYLGAIFRVAQRMGISRREMAVLLEMSPYGQSLEHVGRASPDSGWVRIPFPMNISYLRSEYARLGPAQPQAADPQAPRASVVRVDLRDSARAMENPTLMSRDLTNASVEVQLDEIARALVAHRTRAVLIVATDVRDKLFMATELRRRVRDLQVILYGTNSLLVRDERNQWLRGALVAATYPLFLENQFWDPTRLDRYRTPFPNDLAEGLYNAVLVQLDAVPLLAEYGEPPATDALRPPVWVSIVGSKGFLPLTIASHGTATGFLRNEPSSGDDPPAAHSADHSPADETMLLLFPFLLALTVLAFVGDRCVRGWDKPATLTSATTHRLRLRAAKDRHEERHGRPAAGHSAERRADDLLMRRAIHRISLRLHTHLYSGIRAIALLGLLLPVVLVPLHHRALRARPLPDADACISPRLFSHACDQVMAVALVTVATLATLGWCGYCVVRAVRDTRGAWGVSRYYATRGIADRPWCALSWQLEIVLRFIVGIVALGYAAASLAFFLDVWKLHRGDAMLFFERYSALDSGVSAAIPLVLIGACYFVWTTWHVQRTKKLNKSTAFEEGQVIKQPARRRAAAASATPSADAGARRSGGQRLPAASGGTAAQPSATAVLAPATESDSGFRFSPYSPTVGGGSSTLPPSPPAGQAANGGDDERMEEPETQRVQLQDGVRCVRLRLFRVFPGRWGAALVLVTVVLSIWLWRRWALSYEAAVLRPLLPRAVWPLSSWHFPLTAFDALFRYGILAVLGATALGLFRFITVWMAFRRVLYALSETPLLGAFARLPAPITRLGRLTPFGSPSLSLLKGVVDERWLTMQRLYLTHRADFETKSQRVPKAMRELMLLPAPPELEGDFEAEAPLARPYLLLESALREAWLCALHRQMDSCAAAGGAAQGKDAFAATPLARWLAAAEECAATYAVAYVEWVFGHLRVMAFFILCSVVLGTVLLSSYPFQPQSLLQMLFFIVLGVGVMTLVVVSAQMNRDLTLSSINGTNPNKIDFDATFLVNLALFGVVPIFTLISTQFPQVRSFLFSWVAPLLRTLGTG